MKFRLLFQRKSFSKPKLMDVLFVYWAGNSFNIPPVNFTEVTVVRCD